MESFFKTAQTVPLNHYILLSAIIFAIGVIGVLIRRNAIVIFMSIELMLNAANLNLIAFWRFGAKPELLTGMMFAIFSIGEDQPMSLDAHNAARLSYPA